VNDEEMQLAVSVQTYNIIVLISQIIIVGLVVVLTPICYVGM